MQKWNSKTFDQRLSCDSAIAAFLNESNRGHNRHGGPCGIRRGAAGQGTDATFFVKFQDGEKGRFGIERVEDGLNEQRISAPPSNSPLAWS